MNREEALQAIISLCRAHNISSREVLEGLNTAGDSPEGEKQMGSSVLIRYLAYMGGVFIFCGIGSLIALEWEALTSLARVIITLGAGFSFFILGAVTTKDLRGAKISPALLFIAGFLEPAGLFVMLNEYFPEGHDVRYAELFVSGVMLVQFFFTFLSRQLFVLLFFTLIFLGWFCFIGLDLIKIKEDHISLLIGILLFGITWWAQRQKKFAGIGPFWFLVSSALLFHGIFQVTDGSILFLLFSGWILYISTVIGSRTLVVSSTIATISYIGYYTHKYFIDSVGWPIALMGMGMLLILASIFAVRFSQKYIHTS